MIISTNLGAQVWKFTRFMDTPYPKNTGTSGGDMAVGDINGDGKMDLVLSGSGGRGPALLVYLFTPGKYVLKENSGLPALDGGSRIVLADFDGDGKIDAALAGKTSADYKTALIKVYRGDGAGNFALMDDPGKLLPSEDFEDKPGSWAPTDKDILGISDSAGFSSGFFEAGDLDKDGDLDLVFAGGKGFEAGNDPSGQMIQRDWETAGSFLNNGKGIFSYVATYPQTGDISPSGLTKANRCAGFVADLNGDGILDAALSGQSNRGPLANPGIPETQRNPLPFAETYRGDGIGSFVKFGTSGLPALIDGGLWLGDVNSDGRVDAGVLGNTGSPGDPNGGRVLGIWLGMGDGSFAKDESQTQLRAVMSGGGAFGDLDGDGDLDMVVSGNDNDRSLRIYENQKGLFVPKYLDKAKDGVGTNTANGNGSSDASNECDVIISDLDGDGDQDVVVNGRGGSLQLLVFMNKLK